MSSNTNYKRLLIGAVTTLSLIGCGGSSTPDEDNNADTLVVLQGVFIDSAVEGLSYSTLSQSGVTNSSGQFSYLAGEQITFSIGSATLPTVTAAAQVTPRDMGTVDVATNIARLLQSLDQDGFPDNGIVIPSAAATNAGLINFSNSVQDFANDSVVINLVANSGSSTTSLISAEDANNHLNESLGISGGNGANTDNFTLSMLVEGSPWYAIRNFESRGRLECGNKYSFSADGAATVVSKSQDQSQFQTFSDITYTFTDSGVLTVTGADVSGGQVVLELNDLSELTWSANRPNTNDAGDYLEKAFSDRGSALGYSSRLGMNCDTDLPL